MKSGTLNDPKEEHWYTVDLKAGTRYFVDIRNVGKTNCYIELSYILNGETKYFYTVHSELNAILNYRGGSLEGAKLYVSLFPCNECAKAIIQSGIKEVIYGSNKYEDTPSVKASMRMFDAAGVNYHEYHETKREIKINL